MGTLLTIAVALIALAAEPAGEWARFRGPNGSGVSEGGALPAEFGPAKNVVWKTELPQGYSSPIIFESRIYLTGFRNDRLLSFGVDRATGKVLWERELWCCRQGAGSTRLPSRICKTASTQHRRSPVSASISAR